VGLTQFSLNLRGDQLEGIFKNFSFSLKLRGDQLESIFKSFSFLLKLRGDQMESIFSLFLNCSHVQVTATKQSTVNSLTF